MRVSTNPAGLKNPTMEAFFVSTAIVALAEMGDKTQLLALVLAARFRKPWPIVLGILVATLVNHGLAGAVGAWVTTFIGPQMLRWILGASFIAMAVWMLIPDKLDEGDADGKPRWGVFGTTLLAFFLAEMGDKTQIATVMLAAQYNAYLWVVAGTTLGMMLANAPVVWLGSKFMHLIPLRVVHIVSALVFAVLGVLALLVVKSLLLVAVGRLSGRLPWRSALMLGGVLAMGGEFGFVVFAEALKAGLIEPALRDQLFVIVGLSLAATPLLLAADSRLPLNLSLNLNLGCGFLALTGWPCPLCGGTHACAALVQGDWAAAWAAKPGAVGLLLVQLGQQRLASVEGGAQRLVERGHARRLGMGRARSLPRKTPALGRRFSYAGRSSRVCVGRVQPAGWLRCCAGCTRSTVLPVCLVAFQR